MVYTSAAILALAASAVALPTSKERYAARRARREAGTVRKSNPNQLIASSPSTPLVNTTGNGHVSYSDNWTGAVISKSSGTWKSVVGTFTVPTPKTPSGGSSSTQYSASAWVGIDGDTCSSAIWQTGVDFYVQGSSVSYDSWYEWYPDYASDFSGISFSAGDSVTLSVVATGTQSGTATITNNSKGKTVSKTITNSGYSLCEEDAEWIVEDFEECTSSGSCSLVPLANWGTVTFSNAVATTNSGTTYGPSSGTVILLQQNGKTKSSVTTTSTSVTISYVN